MRKIYTILPFFLLLLISCSMESINENMDKDGENGFNFIESKQERNKLKGRNGNSYVYTISEQSFAGFGSETTIEVQKGKVISRFYEAYEISENDESTTIILSYWETSKKELGSHSEGAPAVTMDDLYKTCISQYLIADPNANEVYFETNGQGVMTMCGFVPYGCQDDCYRGIMLSHFAWK